MLLFQPVTNTATIYAEIHAETDNSKIMTSQKFTLCQLSNITWLT